jgi:diguanylate cyclase (GGDEF)-like protein
MGALHGEARPRMRRDSFSRLRDIMGWRVALVLGVLVTLLMVALGILNHRLGQHDMELLSWVLLAVSASSVGALLALPRRLGSRLFHAAIAAMLVAVMVFGWAQGRPMQHWGYIFPPVIAFLLPPWAAFAGMVAFGLLVLASHWPILAMLDLVRFGSAYGLLVCFMVTYALLQEHAARMLRYHSDHDALTNCLNRRTFNEALELLHAEGPAAPSPCAFLLLDIDHFKAVNDQHGHLVGDRVITRVAAELGRELDAGTPLFRYGGEEFAVLLRGGSLADGVALAERLRATVERGRFGELSLTLSVGVAEWRGGKDSLEAALGHADQALYAAKRGGRNRVVAASAGLREHEGRADPRSAIADAQRSPVLPLA